ncbi:AraC family transcriptional regulator [Candidatus Methylospira mobilis]|uniref:AraC family transcriptional regulator n=1 Tax=Candidatus Methylospira mobilis TaxID=1808979 RepID=A0A5Q0BFB1_9GAMM|nr:helix-turn-helix domain-containing protein [Candidatus Methylospira mobilis]QFY42553.1 AraC family transcriptional regulator [Candidatus Methylospira mobilis]WNV04333.1 helix-turn-helix domain-containing protein [Candidatus Methylospira mobilis]
MSLRVFTPSRLLQSYVTAIWDYDNLLGGGNQALSILPDTATYLCFLYADLLTTVHKERIYTTRSGLAGFQSFRSDLGALGQVSGVSARLTPWGVNVFCRGIVRDCAERRVDCRDIFPKYAIEKIEDNLSLKRTACERVQCVESFLLSMLNRNNEDALIQTACRELDRVNGNYPLAKLARTLGLTKRTFERRFQMHIGATPKKYARIVRLRNAILQRNKLSNWAEVAYAAGYYDQSHMIHDFHELYGLSPESIYPQMEASRTIRFSGLLNLYRGER